MFWRGSRPARFHLPGGDPPAFIPGPFVLLLTPLDRDPSIPVSTTGSDGAAHDTGDGCFCHQRHLPQMIVPGFAEHDPGPGIEGIGRGALRGRATDTTRRYRGHARPRAGFHNASWRTVSWVRVTGWHDNDRTRVLPRLNGQPEPRAVLARAPRDLPCSPREPCRPGERGPLLVTALLAVPMLLIHAISERPPKPPPLRHGLPQADCAA
jgi:hypothetical protein